MLEFQGLPTAPDGAARHIIMIRLAFSSQNHSTRQLQATSVLMDGTRMTGVHLVVGASLWVQQEQPERVSALIVEFLRSAS